MLTWNRAVYLFITSAEQDCLMGFVQARDGYPPRGNRRKNYYFFLNKNMHYCWDPETKFNSVYMYCKSMAVFEQRHEKHEQFKRREGTLTKREGKYMWKASRYNESFLLILSAGYMCIFFRNFTTPALMQLTLT